MELMSMYQNWCESSRQDIICPDLAGRHPSTRLVTPRQSIAPYAPSMLRDTTTNLTVRGLYTRGPALGSVHSPAFLSVDARMERITASLLAHELAPFARESGRYQKTIHDLVHSLNVSKLANIPDSEMKKRIHRVLVIEMMQGLFSDLSDEEIDMAREAARTSSFFR